MARAQAAKESWWRQSTLGDWMTADGGKCSNGAYAAGDAWGVSAGGCLAVGIIVMPKITLIRLRITWPRKFGVRPTLTTPIQPADQPASEKSWLSLIVYDIIVLVNTLYLRYNKNNGSAIA